MLTALSSALGSGNAWVATAELHSSRPLAPGVVAEGCLCESCPVKKHSLARDPRQARQSQLGRAHRGRPREAACDQAFFDSLRSSDDIEMSLVARPFAAFHAGGSQQRVTVFMPAYGGEAARSRVVFRCVACSLCGCGLAWSMCVSAR